MSSKRRHIIISRLMGKQIPTQLCQRMSVILFLRAFYNNGPRYYYIDGYCFIFQIAFRNFYFRTFSIGSLRDGTGVSDIESRKKKSNFVRMISVPDTEWYGYLNAHSRYSRGRVKAISRLLSFTSFADGKPDDRSRCSTETGCEYYVIKLLDIMSSENRIEK